MTIPSTTDSTFLPAQTTGTRPKKRIRSSDKKHSAMATQIISQENHVDTQKQKKAKQPYPFTPTKDEAWTQVPVSFNWFEKQLYNATLFPAMRIFVQPQVSEETWTILATLELDNLQSVGDIELLAISILKKSMTSSDERKEEIHTKLKTTLKIYAEKGLCGASMPIIDFIKNP